MFISSQPRTVVALFSHFFCLEINLVWQISRRKERSNRRQAWRGLHSGINLYRIYATRVSWDQQSLCWQFKTFYLFFSDAKNWMKVFFVFNFLNFHLQFNTVAQCKLVSKQRFNFYGLHLETCKSKLISHSILMPTMMIEIQQLKFFHLCLYPYQWMLSFSQELVLLFKPYVKQLVAPSGTPVCPQYVPKNSSKCIYWFYSIRPLCTYQSFQNYGYIRDVLNKINKYVLKNFLDYTSIYDTDCFKICSSLTWEKITCIVQWYVTAR